MDAYLSWEGQVAGTQPLNSIFVIHLILLLTKGFEKI